MGDIIKYIDKYEIITYCLQGYLLQLYIHFFNLDVQVSNNVLYNFILAYFIGFIISRFGSFFFEKLLSKNCEKSNLRFIPLATKKDSHINLLNTNKNFIRNTFTTTILILVFHLAYFLIYQKIYSHLYFLIIGLLVLILLYFSYKKNLHYLNKRLTFFISTEDLRQGNQFSTCLKEDIQYYSNCPLCHNKNNALSKDIKAEICYKCGAKYDIAEETGKK